MLHTVLPVLSKAGVHELTLLGIDLVGHVTSITHRDLLIPAFLAGTLLPLERIELGHGYSQFGQRHTDSRVAHVLVQSHTSVNAHTDTRELGAPRYRRGTCRLGPGLRIIHGGEVVLLVTRRSEVYAGLQRRERIGFLVLTVAPLQLKTGLFRIVGHIPFTRNGVLVTEEELTAVTIALTVVRGCRQAPRTFRVDLTQQLQVHLVADGKVVTAVAQIKTFFHLVAIGRHNQSATITLGKGEEAVRDGQRQGNVGHHKIGRSEHHVLTRTHLRPRHGQIEVGMRIIAGGITTMLEEHLTFGTALGNL